MCATSARCARLGEIKPGSGIILPLSLTAPTPPHSLALLRRPPHSLALLRRPPPLPRKAGEAIAEPKVRGEGVTTLARLRIGEGAWAVLVADAVAHR